MLVDGSLHQACRLLVSRRKWKLVAPRAGSRRSGVGPAHRWVTRRGDEDRTVEVAWLRRRVAGDAGDAERDVGHRIGADRLRRVTRLAIGEWLPRERSLEVNVGESGVVLVASPFAGFVRVARDAPCIVTYRSAGDRRVVRWRVGWLRRRWRRRQQAEPSRAGGDAHRDREGRGPTPCVVASVEILRRLQGVVAAGAVVAGVAGPGKSSPVRRSKRSDRFTFTGISRFGYRS